jgi:DNA-binding MarR family transcriptional regulator
MDALVQRSFDVMGVLTRLAAAHDLSLTQLRLIATLRNHQPTMGELAGYLGLDRSTISGLVDRAAGRGLVERVTNPDDRRSQRVRLTRAGRRLAERGTAEALPEIAALTAHLTAAERRSLVDLLRRP